MDLHVFPSHSEGFPKVTLETAAAGIPSLVYSDYGATEWITPGENGFVVDTLEEMESTVKQLVDNPKSLQKVSKNAIELAKRFDWKVVIKDWEKVLERLSDHDTL
jgi:glycosyltransferase involved in cell wall biosynthesis